ncbi:hypothetical protein DFJ74DRAFT_666910 [Hyaloraphidium curvatum]|nr:hypothetical protein DFJ74DRAFT_666910 [Hyaloraphidium curvatum]
MEKLQDVLPLLIEQYTSMADVMDNIYSRTQANADDLNRYNLMLGMLATVSDCTVPECASCPTISNTYSKIGNGIARVSKVVRDDAEISLGEAVERLRAYLELLEAARVGLMTCTDGGWGPDCAPQDMLIRRERMVIAMTIDTLQKRIQGNKAKLEELTSKGGVQKEMDKLANSIDADSRELESQQRRLAFSRFAVWQELNFLHFHKKDVVAIYSNLVNEQARYAASREEEWSALAPIVAALPLY